MTKETVIITREAYNSFVEKQNQLHALEAAGVKRWEGCKLAKEILRHWEKQKISGGNNDNQ